MNRSRFAAASRLQRFGPHAAIGANESHRAISGFLAQWDRELHAEPAHKIFFLIAVERDRVDYPDRGLAGVEIEPDSER